MPRGLSAQLKSGVQGQVVYPAFFAEFQFDSATVRFWTGEVDITADLGGGSALWVGGGLLGGISMGGEGDSMQARQLTFTLNGVDPSYYSLAVSTQYRRRPAKLWFAVTDEAGSLVLAHYLVEEARMDSLVVNESADTITLVLQCETRLVDMFSPNTIYLNNQHYHKIDPTDDFYSFVPILPGVSMPWGLPSSGGTVGSVTGGTDGSSGSKPIGGGIGGVIGGGG